MKVTVQRKVAYNVYKVLAEDEHAYLRADDDFEPGDTLEGEFDKLKDPYFGEVLELKDLKKIATNTYLRDLHVLTSIKGIGEITAKKILNTLGGKAVSEILKDPNVLNKVPGLKSNQKQAIVSNLKLFDLTDYISARFPELSHVACVIFAKQAIERGISDLVYQQPLYLSIYGDLINPDKLYTGKSKDEDILYTMASIIYTLQNEASASKRICLNKKELEEKLTSRKKLKSDLNYAVEELKKLDLVIEFKDNLYTASIADAHGTLVSYLRQNMRLPRETYLTETIEAQTEDLLNKNYSHLNELQRLAVKNALTRQVSVITGGPGTGKSVTIEAIYDIAKSLGLDIMVVTPTGKAAQRLENVNARTIHAAIGWDGMKANRILEPDIVVVDEASMVDIQILAHLIKATNNAALVLVGDANQLPPVGYGSPFHTMVQMKQYGMCVTELERGYRNNMQIADLADAILKEDVQRFIALCSNSESIKVINKDTPEEILYAMKSTYAKALQAKGLIGLYNDVLVLSPYKSTERAQLSTYRMNMELCRALGFVPDGLSKDMKVIQIVNDYTRMVMNGETGIVKWSYPHEVGVQFSDETVEYSKLEADAFLDKAFAITVHKAQGSESETVWLVLEPSAYGIMTKQLLYTAVTRAKSKLAIFSIAGGMSIQNLYAIFGKNSTTVDETLISEVIKDADT